MAERFFKNLLPSRRRETHKGDYGKVLVVAGSMGMTGAAYLTAQAALRSGSGLVYLGIPKDLNGVLEAKSTEVITLPLPQTRDGSLEKSALGKIKGFLDGIDVIAVGPGLSTNPSTQFLVRKLIKNVTPPIVVDGDGINALVGNLGFLAESTSKEIVLTPHPGEFARLIRKDIKYIIKNKKDTAVLFAKRHNVTLIVKGNNTVVASKGKTYVNKTGNPGMATAGSGDVLTGMIAGFMGQGLKAFDAARLAVHLHGLAGDIAAKDKTQYSLTATDILENIPSAIKKILK